MADTARTQHRIFECGGCDQYHPLGFTGDCRENSQRYSGPDDYATRNGVSDYAVDVVDEDFKPPLSLAQFIADNRLTMTAERVDRNPNMDDTAEGRGAVVSMRMDHWKVTFTRTYRTETKYHNRETAKSSRRTYVAKLTTYFSMGYGHHGKEPKADEVLDCLASDASSVDSARGFEDFCGELGYDTDSRKAEKIYKACQHGAARLKKFLGDAAYQELLYGVERL